MAIINNRCVGVGKTVRNAKVVRIGDFWVELEHEGRRFVVGVSAPKGAVAPADEALPEQAPADQAPPREDSPVKQPGESEADKS